MLDSAAPQLVVNSRTLYFSWLPADPDAVAALVPAGLTPRRDRQVFLNQYVVDDESQTSGFGAYSLTYLGVSLNGVDAPGGQNPGGWWTHYVTSSERVRAYAAARGAPAVRGQTRITSRAGTLVAETEVDGEPLIRARCQVGETGQVISSGHHRYFTARDGQLLSSVYPYVAEPVTPFVIEAVEFLDPGHPTYALRPENPLTIGFGFYSPRASFAYPGGLKVHPGSAAVPAARSGSAHQVPARLARSGRPSGS
ncbi:acetoacetate decarboxylase family protein [Micromonospora phytophila]|uniref:acetoacetate decarboxylase family protein n=1 Tax=Micromonospora phytophila TaxID=709888 RepID=UPI00202E3728|nr:acetoacetate decarboxylase family protein [Micromonospora phytophila]MCM0676196.1 acetoacetate decarboxylase family protein [Micromonospora phytophila]